MPGKCREVDTSKWRKESARPNIARRFLSVVLWRKYGVRLKQGKEDPRNYAHRVWLKNRRDVPDDKIVSFQRDIVKHIEKVKASSQYQALLNGTASDELINLTLDNYTQAR